MNKEEKEAIKELIDSSNLSLIGDGTMIVKNTTIATILNLIDKLKKENETQKEAIKEYEDMITHYNQSQKIYSKIKDKIKEIEYIKQFTLNVQPSGKGYEYCINVLKELLGE